MTLPFRVVIPESIDHKVQSWLLPGSLWDQVERRLSADLRDRPFDAMTRGRAPVDGYIYTTSVVDPTDLDVGHIFLFLIVLGQDEESVVVVDYGYTRRRDSGEKL